MGEVIELFMWGHQAHFRISAELATERALAQLGHSVDPVVLLIGLVRPGGVGHPICIEPEDGPLNPGDFDGLAERAEEIRASDPESKMWHSDVRLHELRRQWIQDRAYGKAIAKFLERKLGGRFFVAQPTLVNDHYVYAAVGLPDAVVDEAPSLSTETSSDGRISITRSLLQGAMDEILRKLSVALLEPDPGSSLAIGIEPGDVARAAGQSLTQSAVFLATDQPGSLFDAMNEVSTTRYEKRAGLGRLIVVNPSSTVIDGWLTLENAVPVRETRTMRKLLETSSGTGAALLTDGAAVYGLGIIRDDYDPSAESVFEVLVSGPGTWDLRHAGTPLMSVRNGAPYLPAQLLSRERFENIAGRVFAAAGGFDVEALWDLAMAASEAEHGTMLVVSAGAAVEAQRLRGQALTVRHTRPSAALIRQVTTIDGAVLVGPDASLVAIGVILDGTAIERGDRSRGARYNSAVRYLASAPHATVIVLVSEDGMLDLLPPLRPQMRRAEREALMEHLRQTAAIEPVNSGQFSKAKERVRAAAFYLTPEQFEEANALVQDHWDRRRAEGQTIWLNETPIKPDPEMSDEYLVD